MGEDSISCFNRVSDILDKDHRKAVRQKGIIIELPRCVKKGLVACRDTVGEFCFYVDMSTTFSQTGKGMLLRKKIDVAIG